MTRADKTGVDILHKMAGSTNESEIMRGVLGSIVYNESKASNDRIYAERNKLVLITES